MYNTVTLEHFQNPFGVGQLPDSKETVSVQLGTVANRAVVRVALEIKDGRIQTARQQVYGDVAMIALSSFCAEWLEGQPLAALDSFPLDLIQKTLALPLEKQHAWVLMQEVFAQLRNRIHEEGMC